jgi:hypothetical protein
MYDSRDGAPVPLCGCDQGEWIDDGRGGYYDNETGAKPVKGGPSRRTGYEKERR